MLIIESTFQGFYKIRSLQWTFTHRLCELPLWGKSCNFYFYQVHCLQATHFSLDLIQTNSLIHSTITNNKICDDMLKAQSAFRYLAMGKVHRQIQKKNL